jgi:uncharacterized protein with ACT and thioredoxin-like domain
VVTVIRLDHNFVWRIISGALDSMSISVQLQLLTLMETKIEESGKEAQILFNIEKFQIPRRLEELTHSKNVIIQMKSSKLLNYITGPFADMTDRIE